MSILATHLTPDEVTEPVTAETPNVVSGPGFWKIAFAVMIGNLMFAILAAIIYSAFR